MVKYEGRRRMYTWCVRVCVLNNRLKIPSGRTVQSDDRS